MEQRRHWDPRISLAGTPIGYRDPKDTMLERAKLYLACARNARQLGFHARAATYLAAAGRSRRAWAARVTPAPPPPSWGMTWSPMLRTWI